MEKIKKAIKILPVIVLLYFTLVLAISFGLSSLGVISDNEAGWILIILGLVCGMFIVPVFIILEIILIVIYTNRKKEEQILVGDQESLKELPTSKVFDFGDKALFFFTFIYLLGYFAYVVGLSLYPEFLTVPFIAAMFLLVALACSIYFTKVSKKNKARTFINLNFLAMFVLYSYFVLNYKELFESEPGVLGIVLNLSIFAGFFLNFYSLIRIKKYFE